MNRTKISGYKIVEDKIKEINKEIVIEDVFYDPSRMVYKFELSNKNRKCQVELSKEFLDDLNDYSGPRTSSYWKNMVSKLSSKLIEPVERMGLIPYKKELLKEIIFEHVKQELEDKEHINRFNLLGKPYQPGSLEKFLNVKFDDDERTQAGIAFDELKNQETLVPTYKDLIHPGDWVKLGKVGTEMKEEEIPREKKLLKAFISYSTMDKLIGAEVKDILARFGIEGFLAHDDIRVSEEWKQRIVDELNKADIFIPLLSNNFKNSDWAPQELGIAYIRDILIIPLTLNGTIPFGFIDHIQGKSYPKNENIILNYLIKPIIDKFPEYMIPTVIEELEEAYNFRYAESVMELLVPYFGQFRQEDIDKFVDFSIKNRQVWDAGKCRDEYLPNFITMHKDKIKTDKLKALSYQIKKHESYAESK